MSEGQTTNLAAIEAVKQQTRSVLDREPVTFDVPEWPVNGEPLHVHCWPATVREEAEINRRRVDAVSEGMDPAYEEILATVIVRAKNADRTRIFDMRQLPELRGGMGDTIRRVARQLNGVGLTPEETAGN